jgi:TolB-like protein
MRYLFEGHTLDTDRRELRRHSDLVPIEPQVFDLLAYLIENRDRVVSKDDLLAAVWKGRIVSESAMTTRINAARTAVGDSGEQQRLIKTLLRKGFRFVAAVSEADQKADKSARSAPDGPSLSEKPSIAVLPFANMSADAEQEYFADGMVEEIITALSRIRWLFVIARNSSFAYKGRPTDVKQVGRELGVRYVLEGSVRKAANRVRITGQLIDASSGAHLWADRFEGTLEDVFDLQDRVTASVVGAIAPQLERLEIERAKRKPTDSLDAYDYFLRGMASVHQGTRDANVEALRLLNKAIELDANFASAYGIAAWCYAWRKWDGFVADPVAEAAEAARLARRATELDGDDAVALSAGGYALAFTAHELDDGDALIERALTLNPNLAMAWQSSGWVKIFRGEPTLAVKHLQHAMRLSPLDRLIYRAYGGLAYAHLFAGQYDEACGWAEKAFRMRPSYLPAVRAAAAAHAHAGRQRDAEQAMAYMRPLAPTLRVSNLTRLLPLRRAEDVQTLADGLRRAGLPG